MKVQPDPGVSVAKQQKFPRSLFIPASSPKIENVVPGAWICGFLHYLYTSTSQVYFLLLEKEQELVRTRTRTSFF